MNFDKGIYAIEHADSTFGVLYSPDIPKRMEDPRA